VLARHLQADGHRLDLPNVGEEAKVKAAARIGLEGASLHPLGSVDGHLALDAVGHHRLPGAPGAIEQGGCAGVLGAGDQHAVRRQQPHKGLERSQHLPIGWIAIGVIVFDVGDDLQARLQTEEGAIVLIGLENEEAALAGAGIHMVVIHHPAHDEGGIAPQFGEQEGDHGGGGRLAVSAGHGDSELAFHESPKEIGALVDGDAGLARGEHLRVVLGHSRRAHHPVRALDVARVMAEVDRHALGLEAGRQGRQAAIRAADGVTALLQKASDGREPAAADADEVYVSHPILLSR